MGTVKENVGAAVEDMMGKFANAKENIKVQVGETKDEYINKVDDSIDVVKGAFINILNVIDGVLGFSVLKKDILEIMELEAGQSRKSLFTMARKCREKIEEKLEEIEILGNPEDAETLKILLGNLKGASIFDKLATTLYWVAKKVSRKIRQWFKIDVEDSVIGSICRSLSGLGKILRAGVKLMWNAAKFAVSFIVAGALMVFDVIRSVVVSIKNWVVEKYNKFTNKDVAEDLEDDEDYFFDDEEVEII